MNQPSSNRTVKAAPSLPLLSLLLLLFVPALPAPAQSPHDNARRTVTDELGREVEIPLQIKRIVSLAPSVTETLFALGAGDRVVGVTSFCDFPPEARTRRNVGMPGNPSLEVLVDLRPDIIIGSSTANEIRSVRGMEALGLPLYGTDDPRSIDDIFDSFRHIAELTGTEERAEELIEQLTAELRAVEQRVENKTPVTALFAIWLEPLIAAGGQTFLGDVLRRAGAEPITADISHDWPRLSMERVVERDPEVLVFTSAHGLRKSFERLRTQPGWAQLRAVRSNRIIWLDESSFRPGPRIVDVIADLAAQLHGENPEVRTEARTANR